MSDLRKAAETALEALDYHFDNEDDYLNWRYPLVLEAKQALRQALEESANSTTNFVEPKALAQPEQEREWVGLTFDERNMCLVEADPIESLNDHFAHELMKEVEAKLREKNGGTST